MAKSVLVYHGGSKPESEAEGAKVMEVWQNWVDSMEDLFDKAKGHPFLALAGSIEIAEAKMHHWMAAELKIN
ncbi:MAG: hypothetical protein OQL09_01800 [Gammaproteobacteria bacterium]|nr:hypothetical protein [Gammaproteobacteria bacterium]